ncbi:hypothetical protein ACS5PK_20770 [Roseateles sp. DB2]|uniref:hypothetical protein n=1 Tax=Roseateles sp. DB2 TaxID=3453717 RepID=UPI003EE866D5
MSFIATHIVIEGESPVSLGDWGQIRAATEHEVALIRGRLKLIAGDRFHDAPFYDGRWIEAVGEEGHRSFSPVQLPPEEWKYWVHAYEGNNHRVNLLQSLMQLLPVSLEFAFTLFFEGERQSGAVSGISMGGVNPYQVRRIQEQWHPRSIKACELAMLPQYASWLAAIPDRYNFVRRALSGLDGLRGVPETSELTIVGLFALIESLITHEPRKQETLDSIIHQVKNKMALLRKRYETAVPLADYFGEASEDTIWSKLYDYRSTVAHGSAFDFQQKGAVLRGREQVVPFLRENVKQLLIMALRDPEFFDDLRRC